MISSEVVACPPSGTPSVAQIRVWDGPVRLGHWLMAIGFVVAWLTAERESWRLLHVASGATVLAVALFRLVWGFIGSATARFADFVRGPSEVGRYLRALLSFNPPAYRGHNPAGAWAIVLLLAGALLSGTSGWLIYNDFGGDWLEDIHEAFASTMLFVVGLHLAGVFISSLLHRDNLVGAMLTGRKKAKGDDAIASAHPWATGALIVWLALAVPWLCR